MYIGPTLLLGDKFGTSWETFRGIMIYKLSQTKFGVVRDVQSSDDIDQSLKINEFTISCLSKPYTSDAVCCKSDHGSILLNS